jgi:hypothetical protein
MMMTTIDVATLAEAQAHELRLREQAGELRLHGLLGRWAEVMGNPEQSRWVGQLLGWEAAERHRRSLERRLRDARIGPFKPLADFDWKWPTHCDRAIVEELMTLTFLQDVRFDRRGGRRLPVTGSHSRLTETAAITNMSDAASFVAEVRELGVRVALDDFGSGASSFGYLKSLAVDYLKIDGRFVKDLLDDQLNDVAVRCFTEVASTLGLKTVAEFVETVGILARLKEIGVDYAQGTWYIVLAGCLRSWRCQTHARRRD